MTTKVDTRVEKNFQIETFDRKSDREDRRHELVTRRNDDGSVGRPGLVHFSGAKPVNAENPAGYWMSTWSLAWPIRIRHRRRDRDHSFPTGPCPKKRRRSRYWRRHPALHSMALAAQQKGKIKP
jgi:hypothetical protein